MAESLKRNFKFRPIGDDGDALIMHMRATRDDLSETLKRSTEVQNVHPLVFGPCESFLEAVAGDYAASRLESDVHGKRAI